MHLPQREEHQMTTQNDTVSEPKENTNTSKTGKVIRKGRRVSKIPTQWQRLNLVECAAQR